MNLLTLAAMTSDRSEFVQFWSRQYRYGIETIYDTYIDVAASAERTRQLFVWKNGGKLSARKAQSVERNFVDRMGELSGLAKDASADIVLTRFGNGGAIWRIFWLHCWQPSRFPIFDQHVFRAMHFIEHGTVREIPRADARKVSAYLRDYLPFHQEFAGFNYRDVDRALFSFGKFLKTFQIDGVPGRFFGPPTEMPVSRALGERKATEVQDPLKPLDCVTQPDPRHDGSFGGTLDRVHRTLSGINLHLGVPLHVRQLFATAQNLSLYAWFVYRFHPVAQLFGYASLERALRERVAREEGVDADEIRRTLHPLMALAVKQGWLKSERFEAVQRAARVHLEEEQTLKMIGAGEIGDEPVEGQEIDEADILSRAAQMDYVIKLAESVPYIRNHIAHGGRILNPGSAVTLRMLAEAINQLFELPASGSSE